MIVLSAATGGSKPAGAPAQTIKIAGTLSAAGKEPGTKGGTIVVSGEHIKLRNAQVDASGRAGGGKVLIGGDWAGGRPKFGVNNQSATLEHFAIGTATTVSVDGRTTINASATESGHGGKVILWSDSKTTFAGTILAQGGPQGGNGGFVETSGHQQLVFADTGKVDTRAPNGTAGTLLLDPEDFFIRSFCEGPCGPNETTASQIQNLLLSQNVVIATNNDLQLSGNGDIFVDASVNWSTNNSLTLNAYRDINIGFGVTIANTGNASGSLVLHADSTGTGTGTVNFALGPTAPGRVDFSGSTGQVSIFYNPVPGQTGTKYENPTNFACSPSPCSGVTVGPSSQLTAYMLVNNASDLNAVRSNTSATAPTRSAGPSMPAVSTPIPTDSEFQRPVGGRLATPSTICDRAQRFHDQQRRAVRHHPKRSHRPQPHPREREREREPGPWQRPPIGRHARGRQPRHHQQCLRQRKRSTAKTSSA